MKSCLWIMFISLVLPFPLVGQEPKQERSIKDVTAAEKKAFINKVSALPTRGEFFTDKSVKKAAPDIRVLLALTPEDLGQRDIYPFRALRRGLCDLKESRRYALRHFGEIAHPDLRLSWAVMLFDGNAASPEIIAYLKAALRSDKQSKTLAELTGPDFTDFKKRVSEAKTANRSQPQSNSPPGGADRGVGW